MKRVTNTKTVDEESVIYRMSRRCENGDEVALFTTVSRLQHSQFRREAARQLRKSREQIRRVVRMHDAFQHQTGRNQHQ